jgi:Predicted membrane protein
MQDFLSYSVRVIIVYFFTYLCTRALTKKAIAEMTAYEVAGLMILANVAAEPLVDKVVIKSVYGSGFLIVIIFFQTKLALKNKFTPILEHTPTLLVKNGQLDMRALSRVGLSLNQFEGLLRQQGYDKVSDLDTVIMEPQGELSIFPKPENKPVTIKDLKLKSDPPGFTIPLVMDGLILKNNLHHIKKNEKWLIKQLNKQGIYNLKTEVALAELSPSWQLFVFRK